MADPVTYAASIDLQETNVGVPGRDQGWRIELTVRVQSGFQDAALFRYQKISADEVLFTGVCSPADLADYGLSPSGDRSFFRSAEAKLDFASRDAAYQVRDDIIAEVETLCTEMARINNNLSPMRTIEVSS